MSTAATSETPTGDTEHRTDVVHQTNADSEPLAELRSFFVRLLKDQCQLAGGILGVVYLAGSQTRSAGLYATYHTFESGRLTAEQSEQLAFLSSNGTIQRFERLATEVCKDDPSKPGRSEALTLPGAGGVYQATSTHRALAVPLVAGGNVEGASIVVVPTAERKPGAPTPESAIAMLALTSARFESFLWQQQALREAEQRAKLRETLELLDVSHEAPSARAMSSLLCHEIQRRFGCTRVAVGLVHRDAIRLTALSGVDELDKKGEATLLLEAAMEECADQNTEVLYPSPPEMNEDPSLRRVTRAHETFSRKLGPSAIVSLPLRVEGDLIGAMLLERTHDDPFPASSLPLLRLIAEMTGPALWTRRLADRGILAVVRDRTLDLGTAMVGPRHTITKLVTLIILLAIVLAAAVPIPARVSSDAEVTAVLSRMIHPPFDGYLAEVNVRPGDVVTEGQVLARLDTADLALERAEAASNRRSLQTQLDAALTNRKVAEAESLSAAIAESDARLDRLDDMLARAEIVAPIPGSIGRGDLEAFVGSRLDPSQPLFELVGTDHVLMLAVDERDLADVEIGQTGTFALKATPGQPIPIEVARISPMAEVKGNDNVYVVEAKLRERSGDVRPGMTGIAHLESGWTTALASLLSPIVDEVRLRMWW